MSASLSELRERLTAAISEVALAEDALETVLRALSAGPRAEKVTVTAAVSEAFARLRVARDDLKALRDQLGEG